MPPPNPLNAASTHPRLHRTLAEKERGDTMIDNLSLGLTHGLMLLAAWLLLKRPDLDSESPPPRHWRAQGRPRGKPQDPPPGA